jgi:hypothetical protein
MEGISDIRITGIDETRPPRIRKEPYIDLCFRLTHKAPVDWCHDFTDHLSKEAFPADRTMESSATETGSNTGRDRRAPTNAQESRGTVQLALH